MAVQLHTNGKPASHHVGLVLVFGYVRTPRAVTSVVPRPRARPSGRAVLLARIQVRGLIFVGRGSRGRVWRSELVEQGELERGGRGGATFSAPVLVEFAGAAGNATGYGGEEVIMVTPQRLVRNSTIPAAAVGPDDTLYVVWNEAGMIRPETASISSWGSAATGEPPWAPCRLPRNRAFTSGLR